MAREQPHLQDRPRKPPHHGGSKPVRRTIAGLLSSLALPCIVPELLALVALRPVLRLPPAAGLGLASSLAFEVAAASCLRTRACTHPP